MAQITGARELRALYGDVNPKSAAKELTFLDGHCRRFIELSPFLLLATSDGQRLDVSPKGDGPGVAVVLDDRTLAIPDWPGNRRIDGMLNLIEHPGVGIIFLIPNVKETLRVNGRATIHDDADLKARFETRGKLPITVLKVAVEEVFLHCAKALIRSELWLPETWPDRSALPTMGEMIKDHAEWDGAPEPQDEMEARQAKALY